MRTFLVLFALLSVGSATTIASADPGSGARSPELVRAEQRVKIAYQRRQGYQVKEHQAEERYRRVRTRLDDIFRSDEWVRKIGGQPKKSKADLAELQQLHAQETDLGLALQRAKAMRALADYRADLAQSESLKLGGRVVIESF